ncbi:MAG: hypothetical protein HZB55_04635 [Deltaproteobacteria bacterium]|nr:hypothetical protein [Deltaproteobacteria bacterium]
MLASADPRARTRDLPAALGAVLRWSAAQDYAGFGKFDLYNSPFLEPLRRPSRRVAAVLAALWARSPLDLRRLAGLRPSRNPKGIALFAVAYLRRRRSGGPESDLAEARRLLAWLDEHPSPGWERKCWGYDYPWVTPHFSVPRHGPNIVVTGNVTHAFLEAFEDTGEVGYLETARSAVSFLLEDLAAPVDTPEMRSIGYVPGSQWGVLNINGLAASLFARTARHTGDARLAREARRLIAFLVDKQTDYGAWHYAWPARTSGVKHDNYHTGNVLDWILDYTTLTGDSSFRESFGRGLEYYRDHLFLADGTPKWRSDRVYPADVHSAAQAVVTFAKASLEFDPAYLAEARKVARWAVDHLQDPSGRFYYQRGRFWTKRYTLMRWCNAWMACALSSLLLAESRLGPAAGEGRR